MGMTYTGTTLRMCYSGVIGCQTLNNYNAQVASPYGPITVTLNGNGCFCSTAACNSIYPGQPDSTTTIPYSTAAAITTGSATNVTGKTLITTPSTTRTNDAASPRAASSLPSTSVYPSSASTTTTQPLPLSCYTCNSQGLGMPICQATPFDPSQYTPTSCTTETSCVSFFGSLTGSSPLIF